jgi:O-antigen/teichoic acid export membrane protein
MDVRRRYAFLAGAASNWLAFAATLAVSFFLTPHLIADLGKPRYDVWCVVESVLAYFTLLDLGVAVCLVRFVARHRAAADQDGLNRIASASLAVFLVAGLVAMAVGVPVLFALAPTLDGKVEGDGDVLPFMLLMLANLAATLPLGVFPTILDGLEKFTSKSAIRLGSLAVRTAGIVWCLTHTTGLFPLAVVYTATNAAEHLAMALLCRRALPGLRFRRRFADRATLRQVRGGSTDAFLTMLAGRVSVQTGAIVIGLFLPGGQVTFFATAARLVEYAKTLLRTVTGTLTPGVSAMDSRGDHAGIARLYLSATKWVLYLVLPIHLGLLLFGRPFLTRWVGPEFVGGSYPALAILSATLTLGVAQSVSSRFLYGLGRLRMYARLALVDAAVNVALTALLIGPFGVVGVAVAVAAPNVVFCVVVLIHAAKQLGVSGRQYLTACGRPVMLILVPLTIWLTLGEADADWGPIFATGAAGLVPYAVAVAAVEWARRSRQELKHSQDDSRREQRDAQEQGHGAGVRRPVVVGG